MAAGKTYVWYDPEIYEGGLIGDSTDLATFLADVAEGGYESARKTIVAEIGRRFTIEVNVTAKLKEEKKSG